MKAALLLCAVALTISASSASARVRPPSDDDVLQAACYPDVQRLCGDAIPDENKIRACMKGKRSMVSAKCMRAYKRVHG